MKIKGNYTLKAAPGVVWNMVMNPDILEKVTPGIKELKELGIDNYEAISEIKVGPVKGEFKGTLSIKDKIDKESCVLVVDQKSKIGNVVAEIGMKITPIEDESEVNYTGEARMSGVLARMGQRIMSGVVSNLSKQFFQAMEKELEKLQ